MQKRSQKCMVMKFEVSEGEVCGGFFGGNIILSIFPKKNSLQFCHQYSPILTTFFTLKLTITKDICHLVLTLGAISRKVCCKKGPVGYLRAFFFAKVTCP